MDSGTPTCLVFIKMPTPQVDFFSLLGLWLTEQEMQPSDTLAFYIPKSPMLGGLILLLTSAISGYGHLVCAWTVAHSRDIQERMLLTSCSWKAPGLGEQHPLLGPVSNDITSSLPWLVEPGSAVVFQHSSV